MIGGIRLHGRNFGYGDFLGCGYGPLFDTAFHSTLSRITSYNVCYTKLLREIPNDIDVLLIYNAKNIPEKTQLAIDQYMLKGGRALVFSDAAPEHEYFVEAKQGEMQKTELNELLNAWGIDFHGDWVVGDFDASTQA